MLNRQQKYKREWLRTGFCLILFLFGCLSISAQDITSGTIQGTVTDEQGAAVAGATVEAKNVNTNFSRTFTTDSDGRFTFLSMPPGRYTVSVSKQGFAKLNQENIDLTVGRVLALNSTLKVSGVSGEVTISGSPTIDTAKTEASTTINQTAISQPAEPTLRIISALTINIPEPIIEPATIIVASNRLKDCLKFF